jgi:hypothetical protein
MVGRTPPVSTGAVHTLISVPSEATKCVTSTKGSAVESVTEVVVAPADFHTPTSTTSRFPVVTLELETTEILDWLEAWARASWTNAGPVDALPALLAATWTVTVALATNRITEAETASARYRSRRGAKLTRTASKKPATRFTKSLTLRQPAVPGYRGLPRDMVRPGTPSAERGTLPPVPEVGKAGVCSAASVMHVTYAGRDG